MNPRSPFLASDPEHRRIYAVLDALAPKRVVAARSQPDAVEVLHPTKGWRRISHKRLSVA